MSPEQTCLVALPNGRQLEYAEYGDPDGVPLIFFHGFMGTHHQGKLLHRPACERGVRVIAPQRAGTGQSSPLPRLTMLAYAQDIAHLADALGLTQFSVGGVSGGGPFALACAYALPERVVQTVVACGMGPFHQRAARVGLRWQRRWRYFVIRALPSLARPRIRQRILQVHHEPFAYVAELIAKSPASDQEVLARPDVFRTLAGGFKQCMTTENAHLVEEYCAYFNWGFDPGDIPADQPVWLWSGRQDRLIPQSVAQYLADRIPGAHLTVLTGGHFASIHSLDDLIEKVALGSDQSSPASSRIVGTGPKISDERVRVPVRA